MARSRTVYQPDMVAHLWANRYQDSARNAGDTLYFRGDTIYSYGSHFPIARHVETKRGRAVLFTTRGYSTTTARHISITWRACSHLRVFRVADVNATPAAQFADYRAQYVALAASYVKARQRKPRILESLRELVTQANEFAEFFGLRSRLKMPADESAMIDECRAIGEREERRKQAAERKRQAEERKRQAELAEHVQEWVNGERDSCPCGYTGPIRLRIQGDDLETSRGAVVPLAHAVKVFKIVKGLRDKGQSYQRNGHTIHLGAFALDSVDTAGNVRAGCHNVEWEEIARVATLAGVN